MAPASVATSVIGVLSIKGLTRTFGDRCVLDDVTFDVVPGRVTGFVGANGAGKTTTMRIVMGVLAADSGEVHWDGAPVDAERRRSFGYLPEERGLYPKMRVHEQLVFFARLHGVARDQAGPAGAESCSRRSGSATAPTTRWRRCPWATSSGSRSAPRWCTTRPRWCSTSRSAASTRSPSTP